MQEEIGKIQAALNGNENESNRTNGNSQTDSPTSTGDSSDDTTGRSESTDTATSHSKESSSSPLWGFSDDDDRSLFIDHKGITLSVPCMSLTQFVASSLKFALDRVYLSDPNITGTPVILASDGLQKMTGYNYDEIIGQRSSDFLKAKEDPHLREMAIGQEVLSEAVHLRKDGSSFWSLMCSIPMLPPHASGPLKTVLTSLLGISGDHRLSQLDKQTHASGCVHYKTSCSSDSSSSGSGTGERDSTSIENRSTGSSSSSSSEEEISKESSLAVAKKAKRIVDEEQHRLVGKNRRCDQSVFQSLRYGSSAGANPNVVVGSRDEGFSSADLITDATPNIIGAKSVVGNVSKKQQQLPISIAGEDEVWSTAATKCSCTVGSRLVGLACPCFSSVESRRSAPTTCLCSVGPRPVGSACSCSCSHVVAVSTKSTSAEKCSCSLEPRLPNTMLKRFLSSVMRFAMENVAIISAPSQDATIESVASVSAPSQETVESVIAVDVPAPQEVMKSAVADLAASTAVQEDNTPPTRSEDPVPVLVEFVSVGMQKLTGLSPEEGQKRTKFVMEETITTSSTSSPSDNVSSSSYSLAVKTCTHVKQPCAYKIVNRQKDGTSFWSVILLSPLIGAKGNVEKLIQLQYDACS